MSDLVFPSVLVSMSDGAGADYGMGAPAQVEMTVNLTHAITLEIVVREVWRRPEAPDTYAIDVKQTESLK
jgi:hypothetical protein